MKLQTTKSGFTLIELLVVITIIGILATWAVSIYTSQIQKARDSTRITSLEAIKASVEQFYQDTSEYPQWWADWLTWVGTDVQDYLPKLPRDPKDHQPCNGWSKCGYAYIVADDSNWIVQWAYELSTGFENSWNTDNKSATDWWNDPIRLELTVWSSTLATAKLSTEAWWNAALTITDNPAAIHIWSTSATSLTPTITAF